MLDIIIPTCKQFRMVSDLVRDLRLAEPTANVLATCRDESAAKNRNYGLDATINPFIVMVDDDIEGFGYGFASQLICSLLTSLDCAMMSARLMNKNCEFGLMCGNVEQKTTGISTALSNYLPSACVAFERSDLRFGEEYIGSGFEDQDYCRQISELNDKARFLVNNDVKVIHRNEMKNQMLNWSHNMELCKSKWGRSG